MEFCICSAVIASDGTIVRGHRHDDCFATIKRMNKEFKKGRKSQGFITSKNRYVDRWGRI